VVWKQAKFKEILQEKKQKAVEKEKLKSMN